MNMSYLKRVGLPAFSGLVAALTLSVLLSGGVHADGMNPKVVAGYIWNNIGDPLEGADVTVNIRNSDNSIQATLYDTSDGDGYYMVTFNGPDWDPGDTIEVISTYEGDQEDNSTIADSEFVQYVNISYPWPIPQFGGALGFAVAGGAVGLIAIVAIVYTKRKPKK